MQCIQKSIRIAKFYLNCAISYNLYFEIMQCLPKSIRIAKFYFNCAISYNLHFEIMQCIPKLIRIAKSVKLSKLSIKMSWVLTPVM